MAGSRCSTNVLVVFSEGRKGAGKLRRGPQKPTYLYKTIQDSKHGDKHSRECSDVPWRRWVMGFIILLVFV